MFPDQPSILKALKAEYVCKVKKLDPSLQGTDALGRRVGSKA